MLVACDSGSRKRRFFVLGSIWASRDGAFFDFEKAVLELRIKNGYWREFKWKHSKKTPIDLKSYSEFIDLFLNKEIFYSCMVVDEQILKKYCKDYLGKNFKSALPNLIYIFISRSAKRYCIKKSAIHMLFHTGEFNSSDDYKYVREAVEGYFSNSVSLKQLASLDNLQEGNSHICSSLQVCDLLTGAVSNKQNHLKTAHNVKNEIIRKIEDNLKIDLSMPTPIDYKKFNIWSYKPYSLLREENLVASVVS